MTERGWLTCADPYLMLSFLDGKSGDRKFRLFGCAACRRVWRLLADERSRNGVEVAERYADGEAAADELAAARSDAWSVTGRSLDHSAYAAEAAARVTYGKDGYGSSYHVSLLAYDIYYTVGEKAEEYAAQCALLRDIFGNPFRPVAFDPAWRTATAVALAQGIYDERAFDRLPILADALQDAGCDHPDVLDHCRGPGEHARGCWVVDLVLGKE